MILKKVPSLLESKGIMASLLVFGFGLFLVVLILMMQKSWGNAVQWMCGLYSVATGLFFIAQIVGFIISHTHYSERIEAPKFAMLENEEAEWAS